MANWSSTEKQSNATGNRHHSSNSTRTHPLKLSPPQFTFGSSASKHLLHWRNKINKKNDVSGSEAKISIWNASECPRSTSASQAWPHDSRQSNIHNTLLRCIGNNSPRLQWTTGFHFLSQASSPKHASTLYAVCIWQMKDTALIVINKINQIIYNKNLSV